MIVLTNLSSPFLDRIQIAEEVDHLSVQINHNGLEAVIMPLYLNFNSWNSDFENLQSLLNDKQNELILAVGDMNGRIGTEQEIDEEINLADFNNKRKSKDSLVNANGRKLLDLFNYYGLIVLNGRSVGDPEGEHTLINARGSSVIDLAAVSINLLPLISNFKVINFPGSDHLPIECSFKVGTTVSEGGEGARLLPLLPKLRWSDSDKTRYCDKVGQALSQLQLTDDSQSNVNNIVSCIVNSTPTRQVSGNNKALNNKQVWFDFECLSARKRVFRLLNLFRKTNSELARQQYLTEQKKYKSMCIIKKNLYTDTIINKINASSDTKTFWSAVNKIKKKDIKRVGNISNEKWVNHFKLLLNPPLLSSRISFAYPQINDELLDRDFSLNEMAIVLRNVKTGKAPGFDRVPYEFFKYSPAVLKQKLILVYNHILQTGVIPSSFKRSIIFPLHKKGGLDEVGNYRGLSFIDCVSKIFLGLVNNRLNSWTNHNNVMSELQAGFRKGYSTIDNIFNLSNMVHLKLAKKEKLFCFFVDFSSAFDTIDRQALIYKLSCIGISTKIINLLSSYYVGTTAGVWCKEGVTESFETKMGLRQGCILSPLMFSLFINDLPEVLEGGCSFGTTRVNMLMYADDIVIMSPTAAGLQHMMNRLQKYCETWNLLVNLNKSKVIVFRKGGQLGPNDRWRYNGNQIEVVNSYKYLGINFTTTLSWRQHLSDKSRSAKTAMNVIWGNLMSNTKIPISVKFKIFDTIIRAILSYGSQVWGFLESSHVEAVQRDFIKRLFRLPYNTPHYALYLEVNIDKLWVSTLKTNMSYLLKALSVERNRLTGILARQVIEKDIYWCKEWKKLGNGVNTSLNFDVQELDILQTQLMSVVEEVRLRWRSDCVGRARTSRYHQQYLTLDLDLGDRSAIRDDLDISTISWAIKTRAELVNLNYKPWLQNEEFNCSLCNLHETETVFHFMAICPILKHIRKLHFGKNLLGRAEFEGYLNGRDWRSLGGFMKDAWGYRWHLTQEFNH